MGWENSAQCALPEEKKGERGGGKKVSSPTTTKTKQGPCICSVFGL